jgi:hypothetical protein
MSTATRIYLARDLQAEKQLILANRSIDLCVGGIPSLRQPPQQEHHLASKIRREFLL